MISRDLIFPLKVIWSLNQCDGESGLDVPLDMAMESPYPGIIRLESNHQVGLYIRHDSVALQGGRRKVAVACEGPCVRIRAFNYLELMPVEVPWVEVVVVVV